MVRQIPTAIKTKQSWIPNDTATITVDIGNLVAGGSVAFTSTTNATCTGSAVYAQTVAVPGGGPSAEVSTTNDDTPTFTNPLRRRRGLGEGSVLVEGRLHARCS